MLASSVKFLLKRSLGIIEEDFVGNYLTSGLIAGC